MVSDFYNRQGQPMELAEWSREFGDTEGRVIGKDNEGDITVSTVWLGLDHQFGDGPPLIFETMIFGGRYDKRQWRYSSEEEARVGHAAAVVVAFGA